MKVRAVIDLMGGVVVRGVGGKRDQYRPIESQLTRSTDPKEIARAIHEVTGIQDFYIADLDAIQKRSHPDRALAPWFLAKGWSLWIDCGTSSVSELASWPTEGATAVIGTETFEDDPANMALDLDRLPVLSLDTMNGAMLGEGGLRFADPADAWNTWRASGIADLILMDLARVGSYLGPLRPPEENWPGAARLDEGARFHAAGGVRHVEDLEFLEQAGYHSALVASAIHDGRLSTIKSRSQPI